MTTTGEKASARNNHASCVINEFLYIHGGHDGDNWLDDFYILDTKKLFWKRITTAHYTPKARACHGLSRLGRKIYLYGGYDGKNSFSEIEVFDTETQLWTSLILNKSLIKIPSARNAHSATVIGKKIYIFGGHYQNVHLNDLVIFDTLKNEWISPELKGTLPFGMRGHTATYVFNKIYFFGGYNGKVRNNDIYRLALEDFSFTKIHNNTENILPRQRHSACVTSDFRILVFGGFDGVKWLNNIDELSIARLEHNLSLQSCQWNLKMNFRELINNPDYSDIMFVVGERKIYAHKSILFTRCEYFRNMFSDHMIERKSEILHIDSFDYDIFLLFIEFLYTADIALKESKCIMKLYELADAYTYESLKKYCEDVLGFLIEYENVIDILLLGYKCSSSVLEDLAVDFISKNRKKVTKNCNLYRLVDCPSLMTKIMKHL